VSGNARLLKTGEPINRVYAYRIIHRRATEAGFKKSRIPRDPA